MMTVMFRIMLIIVSIGTTYLMMRKIRQAKVQIEAAIFWVIFSLMLVLFSVFPRVADFMASALGIYSTPNFLFLFVIFLLMVKLFSMSIHVSQLETRVKELVQKMALDEKEAGERKAQSCSNSGNSSESVIESHVDNLASPPPCGRRTE